MMAPGLRQIYFDANATRVQSPNLRTVNDVLFEILEHNARGQVTREWRAVNAGNPGFNIVRGYNTQRGWLTSLCTSTGTGTGCDVQQWGYEYNLAGQVRERREGGGLRVETFGYDGLARLGSITRSGSGISSGSSTISYDDHGNLCSRFGQSYIYDGQDGCSPGGPQDPSKSPYAVSQVGDVLYQYDANGNVRLADAAGTAQDLSIDYDPLDQAVALTRGVGAASDLRVLYSYGADRSRIKRIDSVGSPLSPTLTTTRYIGRVERITEPSGVVETRRELGMAVYSQRSDQGTLTTKSYVFTDGLGSVDAIRVIAGNAPLQPRPSYDVHGARRDAVTWQAPGAAPSVTRKGYTGHQHIDSLGLIHMGGRLYDPGLGRFLQADPFIDAGTQGLNRYSYVLNDPLTRTDPTGYLSTRQWGQLFTMAISIAATGGGAALVGLSGWQGYAYAAGMGFMQGAVQSPSLKGAAWGAVSGLTFHGIGSYFDSAAWAHRGGDLAAELTHTGYAAKVMAHAVAGGTLSHLQGGKFGSSFAAAGLSQAFAPAIDEINGGDAVARIQRATLSALIGGTASALSGGKFANGAMTAAMGRALNDEMSRVVRATREQESALFGIDTSRVFGSDLKRETKFYMDDDGNLLGTSQSGCFGGDRCVISANELPPGTSLIGHTHAPAEGLQSTRIRSEAQRISDLSRDIPGPGDAATLSLAEGFPAAVITPGGYRYIIDNRQGEPRVRYLGGGNPAFGRYVQRNWRDGLGDHGVRKIAEDWINR